MAEMKQPEGIKDTPFTGGALHDHVISLASLRYDGFYIDAHHSKQAKVTGCDYTSVVKTQWCKFLVHKVNNDVVVFESIRYRNHYLDCNHNKENGNHKILLTHSHNPPLKSSWAQWKIIGNDPAKIVIQSCRYGGHYFDAHHSKNLYATKGNPGNWAQFKVVMGSPMEGMTDGFKVIDAVTNDLDTPITNTVSLKVGVSSTKAESKEDTVKVGVEAEKNFGAGPIASGSIKVSVEWSGKWTSSSSDTWSQELTKTVEIPVPPKTTVRVLQLFASYGSFKIGSSHWKVEKV
eukprot:483322_1